MDFIEQEDNLKFLGVHDLRNLARLWGVKSPTTKVKEELINAIVELSKQGKMPEGISKKGRPVKSGCYKEIFNDAVLPQFINQILNKRNFIIKEELMKEPELAFNSKNFDLQISSIETKIGFLRQTNEGYYFIDETSDNLVYVPNIIIAKFSLEVGDLIKTSSTLVKNNIFIANTILEINNCPIEKFDLIRNICNKTDVIYLEKPQKIGVCEEGSKTYLFVDDFEKFLEEIPPIIAELEKNNFVVKFLATNLPIQQKIRLDKTIKCDKFISYHDDDSMHSYESVTNALQNASVLAREGKKVVLIAYNIHNIMKEMKTFFKHQNPETNYEFATEKLKRSFLGVNRIFANNGSLTLLLTLPKDTPFEEEE